MGGWLRSWFASRTTQSSGPALTMLAPTAERERWAAIEIEVMAGKRSPEHDAEYEADRRFALGFSAFLDALPRSPTTTIGEGCPDASVVYREAPSPDLNLTESLADGLAQAERRGRRTARTGLRLALQDLLQMSRDLTPAQVRQADTRLGAAGLATLSAMRRRVWQTIPKALKRAARLLPNIRLKLTAKRWPDCTTQRGKRCRIRTLPSLRPTRRCRNDSRACSNSEPLILSSVPC